MRETIGAIFAVLLTIFAVTWAVQGNDFFLYKTFAPKYAQVQREVFEETKSYNQGMIQELQNMQFQYVQAKPEQKDALASIILHRVADYDVSKLPPDLRNFVYSLRTERTRP